MLCDRARMREIQLLWRRTIKFVSAELSLIIAIIVTNTSGQANTLLYDFFFLYKNLNLSEIWIVCKLQIDSAPIVIPTPSIAFCTSILSIEHMIWWRICRILPPHSLKCCIFIHALYIWAIHFFYQSTPFITRSIAVHLRSIRIWSESNVQFVFVLFVCGINLLCAIVYLFLGPLLAPLSFLPPSAFTLQRGYIERIHHDSFNYSICIASNHISEYNRVHGCILKVARVWHVSVLIGVISMCVTVRTMYGQLSIYIN